MIIDSHVHIGEPPSRRANWPIELADGTEIPIQFDGEVDLSVESLFNDMDKCHIDKALVMAFSGWVSNEYLSKVVKAHSKRLLGFSWVNNPKTDQSVRELENAVYNLGLKGLKLHPGVQGFTPADQEILPLIRRATEFNIPVLIHTYPWPPGYFYNCLPEHIDILKNRVPEATIIIAHMGGHRFLDLLEIAPQPGIYVETSFALTMIIDLFGIDFATKFIRRIGIENVIFGSDWAGSLERMTFPLDLIQKMELTSAEKEKILCENIRQAMNIQP